jgi:hypothetical protein
MRLHAAAILTLCCACAEDTFQRHAPELYVRVYQPKDYASSQDDEVVRIDLGTVPVYSKRIARFELENPTTQPLVIERMGFVSAEGATWLEPQLILDRDESLGVPAGSKRLLEVAYACSVEGAALAVVEIVSNAGNGRNARVEVSASGLYQGEPDIDIRYNANTPAASAGPQPGSCDTDLSADDNGDGIVGGCRLGTFDMGGAGLGGHSSAILYVVNTASCDTYPGSAACATCVLTLDKDPTRQNIGVALKGNPYGYFRIESSVATPTPLPQSDQACPDQNVAPIQIRFNAPDTEGAFEATLVIESNDPDEPLLEIPIKAKSVNAPIAIAGLRAFDVSNPSAPYSVLGDIEPYDRVYLDGRAKGTRESTHDPANPNDPSQIVAYSWEIVDHPSGADPALFALEGQGTGLLSFYIPLAGHYEVLLTVTNQAGLTSLDAPEARATFDAIPSERLHVQLVWDDATNDQDLHITNASVSDLVCNTPNDCYFGNRSPRWFSAYAAGDGPNPSLDVDDTNGLGPENINIEEPRAGTYRVYVHYYSYGYDTDTRNTVRIWLNGIQVAEYSRTLNNSRDLWAVADITWLEDGTGSVTPYTADAPGSVGAVASMSTCSDFSFP